MKMRMALCMALILGLAAALAGAGASGDGVPEPKLVIQEPDFYPEAKVQYVSVKPGGNVTLEVIVSGYVDDPNKRAVMPPITFEWFRGNDLNPINDETGATLTLKNVRRKEVYTCVVSRGDRSKSVDFFVTVEDHFSLKSVGQTTLNLLPGESARLEVKAESDNGGVTYQWYRLHPSDDDEDEEEWQPIMGETGTAISVSDLTYYTRFYCLATNKFGEEDRVYFNVFIDNGLSVREDFEQITVQPGESAYMAVHASCDRGELHYEWSFEGDTVEDATTSEYLLTGIQEATFCSCSVTDDYGNEVCADWQIFIENGFTVEPDGLVTISCRPEEEVTLKVKASCSKGELKYKWSGRYYDFNEQDVIYTTFDSNGDTLDLGSCKCGKYTCMVTDTYGNQEIVRFTVNVDTGLTAWADSRVEVASGQSAQLAVEASAADNINLHYFWYRDDRPLDDDGATLTTGPLTENTLYRCDVYDEYGGCVTVRILCAVTEPQLQPGRPVKATIEPGTERYYSFTPAATGIYSFGCTGNDAVFVNLYDGDMDRIARDYGSGRDGFLLMEKLEAGREYHYAVSYDYGTRAAAVTLTLTRGTSPDALYRYNLLVGQTFRVPAFFAGESDNLEEGDDPLIESLRSMDGSVLSVHGQRITAEAPGETVLELVCAGETRRYAVTVSSGRAVVLPSGLKRLEAEAFAGDSAMRFVKLPQQLERIGRDVFKDCPLQQLVISGRNTVPVGGALRCIDRGCTIVCPKSSHIAARYSSNEDVNLLYLTGEESPMPSSVGDDGPVYIFE